MLQPPYYIRNHQPINLPPSPLSPPTHIDTDPPPCYPSIPMSAKPQPIVFTQPPAPKGPWSLSNSYKQISYLPAQGATSNLSSRATNGPYFDTTRLQALAIYAETGNATETARQLGLPQSTVQGWVTAEDAPQLIDELRATIRYECGWQIAGLVKTAFKQVEEAMDRGVPHVTKHGDVIYHHPSAKDAAITASILLDKWMLVSGALAQSNALLEGVDNLSKQLKAIGSALTGKGPLPTPPTTSALGSPPDAPRGENLVG